MQLPQEPEEQINLDEVFADADWAGNKETRKSLSSAVVFINGQYSYSYIRSQKTMSLSSGESEYYALSGGVSEALALREAVEFCTKKRTVLKAYTDLVDHTCSRNATVGWMALNPAEITPSPAVQA